MHFVYVSQNRNFGELLRSSLERANIQASIATDVEQAHRICSSGADVVLVEMQVGTDSGVDLIHKLRRNPATRHAEFWLTSYGYKKSDKVIHYALQSCGASQYWSQPFSPLDLLDHLQAHKPRRPKPKLSSTAVRIISQIWSSCSSIAVDGGDCRLIFSNGALVREEPPQNGLLSALQDDLLTIASVSASVDKGGDWSTTGERIFSMAKELPSQSWRQQSKYFSLICSTEVNEALSLKGLFPDSAKMLSRNKMEDDAWSALYGLWLMGLVRLSDSPSLSAQSATLPKEPQEENNFVISSRMKRRRGIVGQLASEYERLRTAGSHIILGLPEDAPSNLVRTSADRMRKRYDDIMKDPKAESEAKQLANQMLRLVENAVENMATGTLKDAAEHEKLHDLGKRFITSMEWTKADKALSKAHQMCIEDSGILAAMGWARFHNPEKNPESRREEAMESLMLALHLDSSNVDTLVYLSRAYLSIGQPENALTSIRRATTLTPDTAVQDLRQEIEDAISQSRE
jgi:CheY-like chemotaxis protein